MDGKGFKGHRRKKIDGNTYYLLTPSQFVSTSISIKRSLIKNKKDTITIRNLKAKIAYYKKRIDKKIKDVDLMIEQLKK